MKKGVIKKFVCGLLTGLMFAMSAPAIPSAHAADQQELGTKDGYDYELWNQNYQGTATMNVGSNGAFTCSWSGIENCLFRTGKKLGSTKKYGDYNGMYVDYDVDYEPKGNSYMCIYGWTENPTVEYYIVEAWGSWRPPGATNSLGTVEANGNKYDIYRTQRVNQPSIHGTETFYQYWSVRQDNPAVNNAKTHIEGRISISKHFDAWSKAGLDMTGTMYEVALNIEGYQSNGSASVNKNGLVIGEGDGDGGSVIPSTPVEPDENGYYFHSTFEDGEDSWSGRGDASAAVSGGSAYKGSKLMSVTGRTDSWNGVAKGLSTSTFVPGSSYGFSVMAMQNSTASEDFKLTLQCTIDGEETYHTVAENTGVKGEWVQLTNPSFTIPAGASNLILYVETADTTTNFYIDEAIGGIENCVSAAEQKAKLGDVNLDGKVDGSDLKALENHVLGRGDKINFESSDMDSDGKIDSMDVVLLRKAVSSGSSDSGNTGDTGNTSDPTAYMESVRSAMTNDVPSSATSGNDSYGTLETITYYSTIAAKNKYANVILPEGYTTNEKYPVLYINHGIFGDHTSMADSSMKVRSLAGNLAKSGEAEKMIIVLTSMYTSKTSDQCQGFTVEETQAYDAFREDLTECLMPYIEKNYSVKTGRDNTAISGFSMGGREALYIGITRPEYFGYIGAACPAPGITPAQDSFMTHPGNMSESEFKIQNSAYNPYVLMITGGTNDSVVGTFPQKYHETLTANGQDHIWQSIQGGGHDASCVVPHLYNFMRCIFKANGSSSGNSGNSGDQGNDTPSTGGVDTSWIDPSKPMVAISFDDGAVGTSPTSTSMRILNALNDSGFHATFFYVGNWIGNNQAEVKTAYDMGMEIANHTTSHPYLTQLSASEIRSEYDQCAAKLKGIIGTEPSKLLRLPYLATNSTVQSTLSDVPLITCSIDTQDWNNATSQQIIDKIKNAMNDGSLRNSIVLCHETYSTTAEAMEYLCPYLKSQGWQIVTISEMYAVNGKTLNNGQVNSKCN